VVQIWYRVWINPVKMVHDLYGIINVHALCKKVNNLIKVSFVYVCYLIKTDNHMFLYLKLFSCRSHSWNKITTLLPNVYSSIYFAMGINILQWNCLWQICNVNF
jgi:hypothetical protein